MGGAETTWNSINEIADVDGCQEHLVEPSGEKHPSGTGEEITQKRI